MTGKHKSIAVHNLYAYDSEGRQAFSRDGNQYGRDRRAFALYDALGRVAVTGTCQDAADEEWWSQPSSSRPAMTARRSGLASAVNRWGVACGYDWDVELNSIEILTVSYYDDYGFATDNSAMITLPQGAKASPKGLATGTLTALLGNDGGSDNSSAISDDGISGYLLSTNFYDTEERLIETRSQTPGGGLLTATTAYTTGGVPVQTRTRLAQGDTQLTYTNDITVDRHAFDKIQQAGGYVSMNCGGAPDANAIPIAKAIADEAMDSATCIGCGACVAACKNGSAMLFVSAKVSQFALLPQGQVERKRRARAMVAKMDELGFGNCTNTGACAAECPKNVPLSNIARLNREYLCAKFAE